MDKNGKLNVVLLALTGFGNRVLDALINDGRVHVDAVFTVKYKQPFPYYEEQQLIDRCDELGIPCYHGVLVRSDEGMALLEQHDPDLIIVATFKQILTQNVLSVPQLGVVNFHPSLLPAYRGPCPTNCALLNDEKVTGVTAHYITEQLDEGDVLLQRSLIISEADNDGQLRQKMATLTGEMVPELIDMFADFRAPSGEVQDHSLATLAPKPTAEDGYLEQAADVPTIRRKVRALNPLPGTSILIGDSRVAVDRYEILEGDGRKDGLYQGENSIDLIINAQAIRLHKKIN